MSDPETLPAGVHPEVELLPWYATGTLGEADQQRVARHLESCHDCSRELEDLTHIRRALTELSRQEAEPSGSLARSVMARVAADSIDRGRPQQEGSWAAAIDRWFRSLLIPQWVPTLAAVLLIAQMGLLIWVTLPPVERSEVSTRSVGIQCGHKRSRSCFSLPRRRRVSARCCNACMPELSTVRRQKGCLRSAWRPAIQLLHLPYCTDNAMSSAQPSWSNREPEERC